MRASTEMVEQQMENLRHVTGRPSLRSIYDRKGGGWRIEDEKPDGTLIAIPCFSKGHDTNSFYFLLTGFIHGLTAAKEGNV